VAGLGDIIESDIPARLDRLPWRGFHWLVVSALGITWILDGLEVTIVGSVAAVLANRAALGLSATQIGLAASAYIAGAVVGALVFGDLADRLGRKKLFFLTLGVYMLATIASGFAWNFWSFALFRALTGAGIGGEYSAINSAIQEFTPARLRGRIDLMVNGSFWIGAALGALGSLVVLNPALFPLWLGWRLAFIIGGALSLGIMLLRHWVPESPRWLMIQGDVAGAAAIVSEIERRVGIAPLASSLPKIGIRIRTRSFREIVTPLLVTYRRRTALCLTLMTTQAFCYNAIFFTYALILTRFYGIAPESVGLYILPFALGNFLGPLLLGHFFDSIGRKAMIGGTYALSGLIMLLTGWLFAQGILTAAQQTALWSVNFFFASCGASAAYLTVGESFPLEMRARAIGIFYAFGTALGGITGPALFGALVERGTRDAMFTGYVIAGCLMLVAAMTEFFLGFSAERRGLEDVASPLSSG
jgi:MFS family permease